MDERYPDDSLPKELQYVGLTGVLVDSSAQLEFREMYYRALSAAYPKLDNTVPRPPQVHASDLFRDLGPEADAVRLSFLTAIVQALISLELDVLNVGYVRTKEHMDAFRVDKQHFGERVLGLCFLGLLWSMEEVMRKNIVWPVIERDRSDQQERTFSSMLQYSDHVAAHVPYIRKSETVNFSRLGETLYSNKYSSISSAADICSYLLHKRFLRDNDVALGPYAQRLAELGDQLAPVVRVNQVITMKILGV